MQSDYDVKTWAGETTLGRRLFNYNFRLLGREVSGWRMPKAVPMHHDAALSEVTYLWQKDDGSDERLVRVNVAELADWRAAQKHLLRMLQHAMRPDVPRGTGSAAVGDVGFVAREPGADVPAAIFFTRGNVAVAVNSVGRVTVDVSDVAGSVDRVLRESPLKVPFLRSLARARTPKTVLVRAKGQATLVKDLAAIGNAWLSVTVPDGEVRRTGNALVYRPSTPGRKEIRVHAIRTAGSARR